MNPGRSAHTRQASPPPMPSRHPASSDATGATMRSRSPSSDDELALQCIKDSSDRTSASSLMHPLVWLVTTLAHRAQDHWPLLVWGGALALGLLALLRMALHRRLEGLLRKHRVLTDRGFHGLSLLTALTWGSLTAATMVLAPSQPLSWTLLCVALVMCTAATIMLGFNPRLRSTYSLAIMGPITAVEFFTPDLQHLAMLVLTCLFLLYLRRASGLVQADYWQGRQARRLAEQQARDLEVASLTDGLTQLPNRMHFDRRFAHEWARHARQAEKLSLLLIDLDHFKNVNDSFGHPFGDTCLRAVSRALQSSCHRTSDCVARYGGEEFALLLPDTDVRGAIRVAERVLAQVASLALQSDGLDIHVTCSVGVASCIPKPGAGAAALIQAADTALYEAKHAGRNCWRGADQVSPRAAAQALAKGPLPLPLP